MFLHLYDIVLHTVSYINLKVIYYLHLSSFALFLLKEIPFKKNKYREFLFFLNIF